VGEWVYELFITNLDANAFVAEDILDLYHGRGAFEAVLAYEDVEEDPDRWCSYSEWGRSPLANRLPMGLESAPRTRGMPCKAARYVTPSWAPPKEAPAVLLAAENPASGVWTMAMGCSVRTSHGAVGGRELCLTRERHAPLSSRSHPLVE
jgi:hypothetical protein